MDTKADDMKQLTQDQKWRPKKKKLPLILRNRTLYTNVWNLIKNGALEEGVMERFESDNWLQRDVDILVGISNRLTKLKNDKYIDDQRIAEVFGEMKSASQILIHEPRLEAINLISDSLKEVWDSRLARLKENSV